MIKPTDYVVTTYLAANPSAVDKVIHYPTLKQASDYADGFKAAHPGNYAEVKAVLSK